MPKFETIEDIREFFKNASPEDVKTLNRQLGRRLFKKLLLAAGIGLAVGGALILAAKAIEKNESENLDNVVYDTTPDI